MAPKYSVLICNKKLEENKAAIQNWLSSGIKVIWLGTEADAAWLKETYPLFARELLLLPYAIDFREEKVIIDGHDPDNFLSALEKKCPLFNAAQYRIEHCDPKAHIVVTASAGTGKTKVMVDRILYLMHTVPNLNMGEISMITFTRDAAGQMNQRLQEALVRRYELTKQQKYLRWLEQQSQMNISTIHSFALAMLKEYGIGSSFTDALAIRSFKYEQQELVKDLLNERVKDDQSVSKQLGLSFYKTDKIIENFWRKVRQLGISYEDLAQMDWGKPLEPIAAPLQKVVSSIIEELDDEYFEIKQQNNAVAIDDIVRDLQKVLTDGELPTPDIAIKYLFIDEFQDSDLSQIQIACTLAKLLDSVLFVVGDIKQSIYRFRGATDQAFSRLERKMAEMGLPAAKKFTLTNNYRTAAGVLQKMDPYFREWGKMGRLQYEKPVVPFHREKGSFRLIPGETDKDLAKQQIMDVVRGELDRLIQKVENSGKSPTEKDRVVVLVRTNWQLSNVSKLLEYQAKLPVLVKKDGDFYKCEAVRDFYVMLSSFLFCDEPKYIFNFLLTPYAGNIEPFDVNLMEQLNGDRENLVDYLDHFLEQTNWKEYHKQLRLHPVLSVLKNIIDNEPVIETYLENEKARMKRAGWAEHRWNAAAHTKARQYQANLEKLLELLQRTLGGDRISLYDVYNFLKLNIATNRSESEVNIQTDDEYRTVLCMTAHKAKGLEFDTIIIPYTNWTAPTMHTTELLADTDSGKTGKIGWNFEPKKGENLQELSNTYYEEMKETENIRTIMEECRILYVAMTRAIQNLVCIVSPPRAHTWAELLSIEVPEEGGKR